MSPEISLMIEGQEGISWPQWVTLARTAEASGFAGLYRSDHYLSEHAPTTRGSLEAWGTICALAATTSRIKLGTLVSPTTFRHPSVLAKLVITADHVSGGRIDLGMGLGWYELEHRAYGFPFPEARDRMSLLEEQVEIIKRSWQNGPFSFNGTYYQLTDLDALPKPHGTGGPRLILGGTGGPRSRRLAARWADEYNCDGADPDLLRKLRTNLDAACAELNRDPATLTLSAIAGVVVGADRAQVEERLAAALRATFADQAPESWLIGTPEEVAETIEHIAEAGATRVILIAPRHDDLEMIELLGREVVQHVTTNN